MVSTTTEAHVATFFSGYSKIDSLLYVGIHICLNIYYQISPNLKVHVNPGGFRFHTSFQYKNLQNQNQYNTVTLCY